MTTEYVAGLCAIFTAFGAGLATLLAKWTDSRVRIIKAEAEAKKEQNQAELAAEKECADELQARVNQLENSHKQCVEQHRECEQNLARLKGYMEGKFDLLERKVTAIETVQVQPVAAPVQVQVAESSPKLS